MESRMLKTVPLFLTLLRAALAPVMLILANTNASPTGYAICLLVAFLSDVFDGKIARRLGIATPFLRRLDSIADTVFYVAATYCVWLLHPNVILGHATALLLLLGLELGRYVFDFLKFKKEASYHMWSSKLWGLALFVAFFFVLVFSNAGIAVSCAIYLGWLADIEGLMISLILPFWKNDVPTLFHALRLRQMMLAQTAAAKPRI
jgi:CDP-diacylglycerol--glycerol-3-phosphate 3-phosphatidyltransferase